jgi:hypothetical protein
MKVRRSKADSDMQLRIYSSAQHGRKHLVLAREDARWSCAGHPRAEEKTCYEHLHITATSIVPEL